MVEEGIGRHRHIKKVEHASVRLPVICTRACSLNSQQWFGSTSLSVEYRDTYLHNRVGIVQPHHWICLARVMHLPLSRKLNPTGIWQVESETSSDGCECLETTQDVHICDVATLLWRGKDSQTRLFGIGLSGLLTVMICSPKWVKRWSQPVLVQASHQAFQGCKVCQDPSSLTRRTLSKVGRACRQHHEISLSIQRWPTHSSFLQTFLWQRFSSLIKGYELCHFCWTIVVVTFFLLVSIFSFSFFFEC